MVTPAMSDFSIRPAARRDAPLIVALLRELADYEKLLDGFASPKRRAARHLGARLPLRPGLFDGDAPRASHLVLDL